MVKQNDAKYKIGEHELSPCECAILSLTMAFWNATISNDMLKMIKIQSEAANWMRALQMNGQNLSEANDKFNEIAKELGEFAYDNTTDVDPSKN